VVKQTFAFLNLDYDLDALVERYFQQLSTHSRWHSFNMKSKGADRKLMFQHQYGPKWSAFLKEYIGGIIKSAIGMEPRIVVSDELITVDLNLGSSTNL
jgi:hypothetical protein